MSVETKTSPHYMREAKIGLRPLDWSSFTNTKRVKQYQLTCEKCDYLDPQRYMRRAKHNWVCPTCHSDAPDNAPRLVFVQTGYQYIWKQ